MSDHVSRRAFLAAGGAAVFAAPSTGPLQLCVFSKHLQHLGIAELPAALKEIGVDAIDLTVRPGGHVAPERVADKLPRAVDTLRKAGIRVPMITTAIADASSPHAAAIVRTAGSLGIPFYRWNDLKYDPVRPIPDQIEALKPKVMELADLNREHKVCAMYHTHSGRDRVGASIWDLWLLLQDMDRRWVSVNLDVAHATIEGGLGGWLASSRLILPFTRGLAIKDFVWGKNAKGQWAPQWVPLGEGMVDYRTFLPMMLAAGVDGPAQMHYEYPLGGAENGARKVTADRATVIGAMRRDVETLRRWLREAGA